ncbi:MAG: hypothetical protein CMK59_05140 [Proteobacteria bacterium]|nr:hypothetical protein [Pseudomonadota bacterium]
MKFIVPQPIKSLLTERLGTKVLSLLIGLSAWTWIQTETQSETSIKVSIEYISSDQLSLAEIPRQSISAVIRGAQGKLRNVQDTELYTKIDLNDFNQGRHTHEFNFTEIKGLAEGLELLRLSPTSVEIELDQEITKELPLEPNLVGVTREGWTLLSKSISPSSITLSGPQKLLSNIDSIKTEPISIENIQNKVSLQTKAFLPELLKIKSKRTITVDLDFGPISTSKIYTKIPMVVRGSSWACEDNFVTLTLKGPAAELDALNPEQMTLLILPSGELTEQTIEFAADSPFFQLSHNGSNTIDLIEVNPTQFRLFPSTE